MPKRSEDSDGIRCPHCGCRHNKVRHVEHREISWGGTKRTVTRRKRICMHCNVPYTTVETYESEDKIGQPELPPEYPPENKPKPRRNPYLRD